MKKINEIEIRKWAEQNAKGLLPEIGFSALELDHIAQCMYHIVLWYSDDYPIGKFLTAVVSNDFREACYQADNINRKALYLYAIFLANKLPLDYINKAHRGSK